MFRYETSIKLHQTDAAGLLFFGWQFTLAHDAYETLLTQIGFNFSYILTKESYFLPIVHAEADYLARLDVGDEVTVVVDLEKLGETSFILAYSLERPDGTEVGRVRTVHVSVDKKTNRPVRLSDSLRLALEREFNEES